MIQTFKPKSTLLARYIDFFYVFNAETPENISYIALPHVNTAISFFKGVEIQRGEYEVNILSSNNDHSIIEILGKYTQPIFVNYKGKFEEISVVFKPLGANHFFNHDFIEIAPDYSQALNHELWTEFSTSLFLEENTIERIQFVETFLINNFIKQENEIFYKAISYLEDFEANFSIDDIATKCGFTLKTFQRNFIKHLACSPSEYKRIARFRHSLQNKLISKEIKTLTSVSYESNYYDQSYFIREFKKLTQLSPKIFFKNIHELDEKNIVWRIT